MPRTLRRASAGRLQDIALEELTVGQPKPVYHQDSIPRGADVRPLKDGWWIAKIVIRSFSLVFATALVILELVLLTDGGFYWGNTNTEFLACIIPCAAIILWDSSEFITLCCRRGFGITSKAHIGIDITLCLGAACGVALVSLGLTDIGYYIGTDYSTSPSTSAEIAMLAILMILHFVLFIRNIQDRRRGKNVTPRIMYLPTGEPVVVVPRPFPPKPTNQPGKSSEQSRRISSTLDSQSPSEERPLPQIPSSSETLSEPYRAGGPSTERSPERQPYEARRTSNPGVPPTVMPRRKPVPTRGTPYANPWSAPGPDYVPDPEEQARAARGESQAQWMSLDGMEVIGKGKRPRDLTPMTPTYSNDDPKPSYER